jgi:hypothetical protein
MSVSGEFPMRCSCGTEFLSTPDYRELICRACKREQEMAHKKRQRSAAEQRQFRARRVYAQRRAWVVGALGEVVT